MKNLSFWFGILAISGVAQAQQYGWVRVAQLGNPQFTALQTVDFVDSLHGWAAVDSVYRTTDGGNTWTSYYSSFQVLLKSISMLDMLTGWTAGYPFSSFGGIYKTTDGGASWSEQRYLINRQYYGTAAQSVSRNTTTGSTNGYFPDTGKVAQTTNGGLTWSERTIADTVYQLRKVQFVDSLHGWITVFSSSGGLLRTNDGGQSWVLAPARLFAAISFLDTLNGWSVTSVQPTYAYRTTDGGATWMIRGRIWDPMWDDLHARALAFVDSVEGWAFGFMFYQGDLAAVIFRTTDGGLSWSREFVGGGARHINDGKMLDRYHGWAVGDFGSVFAYRIVSSVPERLDRIPKSFALKQNYPNPFNSNTTIEYEVVEHGLVTIRVYDTQGKEVRMLVDSEHEPGVYRIRFDAQGLSSGIYYYTMKTHSFTETKQVVLLK